MKLGNTWILVADASRGRFLCQRKHGAALERVFDEDFHGQAERPPKGPRREHDRRSTGPHAVVDRDRALRYAKAEFARELAGALDEATHASKLDHIVLVAPPTLLGEIRAQLSAPARVRVHAELRKDFVRLSDREIRQRLSNVLYFSPVAQA